VILTGTLINPWVLSLTDGVSPPLKWEDVFTPPVDSVEIEIGSGKGMFLRQESLERPRSGFLGVERSAKFFGICAAKLTRESRPNVRVVRADAFDLLARWVPVGSLAAVHVYFPDPWPKKRHAKRRLLQPALFDLCARAIHAGGRLAIATDVAPYFTDTIEALTGHPSFTSIPPSEADRTRVATNYAVKYAREGRSLHLGCWIRNPSVPPPLPAPPSRRRKEPSSHPPTAAVGLENGALP
jgi:tRNA (guanine-N7-)-methyltransferase